MSPDEPTIGIATLDVPDSLPRLGKGHHAPGSTTPCAMEAAAWLEAEPWSDHPRAVHPVIASIARQVNDNLSDERRQELWPLILASIGTRRRGHLVLRWRLARCAQRASRRYPPTAQRWEAVLVHFGELTGHDPRLVSLTRRDELQASLTRPFAPEVPEDANADRAVTATREQDAGGDVLS